MATGDRKSRHHLRGGRTHGYGRRGQHRKHPAGRGCAGSLGHQRTLFDTYHPGYFGKRGMKVFHRHATRTFCKTLNIDKLWTLMPEEQRKEFLDKKDPQNAPVVDVTQWGVRKVTGRGDLPTCPIIVKARQFTKKAEYKIRLAGGVCVLTA